MLRLILLSLSSLLFANSVWAYDYTLPTVTTSTWTSSGGWGTCHATYNSKPCISNGSYFSGDGVSSGDVVFAYTTYSISKTFQPTSGFTATSTHYISLDAMVGPRNSEQYNKSELLYFTVQKKGISGNIIATSTFSQNITNTSMETFVLNIGALTNTASIVITISGKDGGYWNGNYGAVIGKDTILLTDYDPTAVQSSPTPVYSSGITSAQSTKRTSKLSDTAAHGMEAHVAIDGNSNDVTITQAGDAHYLELGVVGNSNVVDIEQTTVTGGTHYLEANIEGSNNNLDVLQSGTAKTAFIGIDGDSNTANIIQKDSGQHYLQLDMIGDGHTADIVQEGSGNHAATVELTNGGGAWDFDLTQSGNTSKEYSLPHSMSDGTTTSGTCYVAAGCSLTVIQND